MYVGVDIGGTNIRVGAVDTKGKVHKSESFRHPPHRDENHIAELISGRVLDMEKSGIDVEGVGVGAAGRLDINRGVILKSHNAPTGNSYNLVGPISKAVGKKVILANDATAAAWGEHRFGQGRGIDNMVYITISTGIGGGAIVDGNLLLGKDGRASRIGHTVVDFNSDQECGCGRLGHWEGLASGRNIPRTLAAYLAARGERAEKYAGIKSEAIFALYNGGDQKIRGFVDDYLMRLYAAGVSSAINNFSPDLIVMGGSVARNNTAIFEKGIAMHLLEYGGAERCRVTFTELGDEIGVIGAAALAMDFERLPR
ncbi:MAG: ROK family protein [Candidatus Micrarchaeota archaeon]|nr:ROK family protein [Candidatus Micrarchaeota archaeon]